MKTDPCHKCLIEHQGDADVLKCLQPATHIWKPVEGAEVPLCGVHASRLSKLPSMADTIKPILGSGGPATPDAPEREWACNRCMYSWDGNDGRCPCCGHEATHGKAFKK